jgi:hypothetical protein
MREPALYELVRRGRLSGDAARQLTEAVFAALEAELVARESSSVLTQLAQAVRAARARRGEGEGRAEMTAKKRTKRATRRRRGAPAPAPTSEAERGEVTELAQALAQQPGTGPLLTGGDVDADWTRAHLSGDEAVAGSVATPDQDVVDEIGRALGVEQEADAPLRTSEEILRERDRRRWRVEREAAEAEEG